ncbi:MAG: Glutamate--tRNA ligase [Parcubacteria group bacterium Greene0714_7]|nr:MAG: Glutamate--tRNA ligase [Parcubacteria group bacterium Greene0714_7]
MKVITRFAPSPTGFMHIGGVRTALFAYLFAKKNEGTLILRIEDTDQARAIEGSIQHIQDSLSWLGIDWEYGPDKPGPFGSCIQSERMDSYRAFAQKLMDAGHAYPDPYTHDEITAFRETAKAEKRPFLFRDHRPETFSVWDGKSPLRFKVPEIKRYEWNDAVRGELEAGEEALDDFILMKGDGYPTYNFAHIVDDHLMGVTHIFRADEFISSTPRFLSLYDALGVPAPVFVTLPAILRDDRTKKLGKRDGAKDVLEYKTEGYLPSAMVNYLALIGWNPGTDEEIFSKDELIQRFSVDQIQKSGGAFNEMKLKWFNREHILKLSSDEFLKHASLFLSKETYTALNKKNLLESLVPLMRERIQTFSELKDMDEAGEFSFYAEAPTYPVSGLLPKDDMDKQRTATRLKQVMSLLNTLNDSEWHDQKIKEVVWPYAEEKGRGLVLWPFRFTLSGRGKSPDPFTIAGVIGKKETITRIEDAIRALG